MALFDTSYQNPINDPRTGIAAQFGKVADTFDLEDTLLNQPLGTLTYRDGSHSQVVQWTKPEIDAGMQRHDNLDKKTRPFKIVTCIIALVTVVLFGTVTSLIAPCVSLAVL